MPSSDLDLPLLPSAEQIRRREFATIRRGYDPDQVRDYLGSVAKQVEALESDLKDARLQADSLSAQTPAPMPEAPATDPYDRISKRFAGLLATADREASRIVDDAKTDADRIRVDAQANAEAARQEGTDALASAREQADRALAGLSERREALIGQLQEMQSRLLGVANDLETVIESPPAMTDTSGVDGAKEPSVAAVTDATDDATDPGHLLDPRYEDLWVSEGGATNDIGAEVQLEELFSDDADAQADADSGTQIDDASGDDPGEVSMDIPDLASIELDFDQDRPTDD